MTEIGRKSSSPGRSVNKYLKTGDAEISRAQDLVYDGWEMMEEDPRKAKKCFEEAIKLDPDQADAYNGLAGIDLDKGSSAIRPSVYRRLYDV